MLLRYISLLRLCYNCNVYVDDEKYVSPWHFYENSFFLKMWNSEFIAINDFLLSIRKKRREKILQISSRNFTFFSLQTLETFKLLDNFFPLIF